MRAVTTAGERVLVDCDIPWLSKLLADATAGELSEVDTASETVRLQVQADRRPFGRDGWALVGRGAWAAAPASSSKTPARPVSTCRWTRADRCCT